MQKTTEHDLYGIWKLLQYKEGNQYGFDLVTIERDYGVLTDDPEITKLLSNVKAYRIIDDLEEDNERESLAKALFFLRTAGNGRGNISFDINRGKLEAYFNGLMDGIEKGEICIDGKKEFAYQEEAFKEYLRQKKQERFSLSAMGFEYFPKFQPLEFGFLAMLFLYEKRGLIKIHELEIEDNKYKLEYGVGEELTNMLANVTNLNQVVCPINLDPNDGKVTVNGLQDGKIGVGTLPFKYLVCLITSYPKKIRIEYKAITEAVDPKNPKRNVSGGDAALCHNWKHQIKEFSLGAWGLLDHQKTGARISRPE